MSRIPICNAIERSDGINFALRWMGYWMGDADIACNCPAVAVGVYRKWPDEKTYAYLCRNHFEHFKDLPFETEIRRPWFELIGRVLG